MNRKGIILAGGSGTRLHPITLAISKQLLPVYNKPMIYYPMSVLMLSGISEFLIISTPDDIGGFKKLFGTGASLGIDVSYEVQPSPNGIAQALIIGEEFLDGNPSALVLGDNIFYGRNFSKTLRSAGKRIDGATIFTYGVSDPKRYGVANLTRDGLVQSIEEKPQNPTSKQAITGLYFYDKHAPEFAKSLAPSERGELEITALNQIYLQNGLLNAECLGTGFAWFDAGTHESLIEASMFIQIIEKRLGVQIGCIEEIALNNGWIDIQQLGHLTEGMGQNSYSDYLKSLRD
jgi:glucose-1-phosphate thymidylyltransferase